VHAVNGINISLSPVSIQTQSLALRALLALRKRKPQETQALALGPLATMIAKTLFILFLLHMCGQH